MRALIGFTCLLLMACATIPPPAPPLTLTSHKSFEETWATVVRILTIEHGLPLKIIEKASGVIATDLVASDRPVANILEAMDAGNRNSSRVPIRYTVQVLVERTASGVSITIRDHVEELSSTRMGWAVTGWQPELLVQVRRDLVAAVGSPQSIIVDTPDLSMTPGTEGDETHPKKEPERQKVSEKSLVEKLEEIKQARGQELLTEEEYQLKRQQLLEDF